MSGKLTDRTLADLWESYAREVIPPGTSAAAVTNSKFAFYGGASYMLELLFALGDHDVSEDRGAEALERLHQELRAFAAQQGAILKTRGTN
jgi:hypothetical protein